ncbi:TIGR04140 family protein [Thermococcus sp.]
MRRELLTPISPEELEEIRVKIGAEVRLNLLGRIEHNGILLNRILIEGSTEEIKRFMEKLRLARAGG